MARKTTPPKTAPRKKAGKNVPAISFEESIAKLSDVVRDLEEGKLSLDESLERYEEGVGHLKQCQQILSRAERKIEMLSGVDADGNPVTQRFDDEDLTLDEKVSQRSRRRTAKPPQRGSAKKSRQSAASGPDEADVDEHGTLF